MMLLFRHKVYLVTPAFVNLVILISLTAEGSHRKGQRGRPEERRPGVGAPQEEQESSRRVSFLVLTRFSWVTLRQLFLCR